MWNALRWAYYLVLASIFVGAVMALVTLVVTVWVILRILLLGAVVLGLVAYGLMYAMSSKKKPP